MRTAIRVIYWLRTIGLGKFGLKKKLNYYYYIQHNINAIDY
jgi:hypothetical protein